MEGDTPPSHYLTVTNGQAARALCEPEVRDILAPFLTQARCISEVAQELKMDKNAVLLKVKRLERLGLLQVCRIQLRAGRPIKYYRAAAPGFFVPFSATTFETPAAWMHKEYQTREKLLTGHTMQKGLDWRAEQENSSFGLRFFQRPDGIVEADFAYSMHEEASLDSNDAPAIMSAFVYTELTAQEAKELQQQLQTLVQRYERRGEGRKYVLRLGLALLE